MLLLPKRERRRREQLDKRKIILLICASIFFATIMRGEATHTSQVVVPGVPKEGPFWKIKYTVTNNGPDKIKDLWVNMDPNARITDWLPADGWTFVYSSGDDHFWFKCFDPTKAIPSGAVQVWVGTVWTLDGYSPYPWKTYDDKGGSYYSFVSVPAPDQTIPPTGVGGVVAPIDKLSLLAPYVGLASTIVVATAATAIYVKRVKRRKER